MTIKFFSNFFLSMQVFLLQAHNSICFSGGQAVSRYPRLDTAHCQLMLCKTDPMAPNCTLSPVFHIPSHNFGRKLLLSSRGHVVLGIPETKQVCSTPVTTEIFGTLEAKLASNSMEVLQVIKIPMTTSYWTGRLHSFSAPGHLCQKTRKKTEAKKQNTHSTKTNSGINT